MSAARYDTLQRIFTEARGLGPGERTAFLDEACSDDPAARAEVEALLEIDAEDAVPLDANLAGDVPVLVDAMAGESASSPRSDELPRQIGAYRILGVLGEGGMGIVYEAEQDHPKRRVALKVVRTSLATSGIRRRFGYEAQVLGHLRHPGIAQIYEAGSADGQAYFSMELVDGVPLTTHADDNALDSTQRLKLVEQLCHILQHAHQRGVIHRDLKPANVLVASARSGSTREATLKVLDFGVARITDSDLSVATLQTSMGQLVGTVPYMSPEQAAGDPAGIDTRSDVYCVGVMAWELLTGRLPYDVRGKFVHEAIRVIREEEPSSLSSFDRSLRGDVETILAKALEKDKERRYQSIGDFADDIRRYLRHEPIEARPASAIYQVRKFTRRNKALVGGVLATLLVAITGAAVALRLALVATTHATEAERTSYIAGIAAAAAAVARRDVTTASAHLDRLPSAYRGWEHDYLRAQLTHYVAEWEAAGRTAWTTFCDAPVFDPTGRRMFAALFDGSIGVWETTSGRFERRIEFDNVQASKWRIAIHAPTGRFAATATDGSLVVRSLDSGEAIAQVAGPLEAGHHALAWSSDGGLLLFASGRAPGSLQVWDGVTSRMLVSGDYTPDANGDAAFDPVRPRVAAATGNALRIIDLGTGEIVHGRILGDESTLAYAPDGSVLVAAGLYGNDFVLDAGTLQTVAELTGHLSSVTGLCWSPEGSRYVTTTADGTLRIWRPGDDEAVTVLATGMIGVSPCAAFMPDGRTVVVASDHVRAFALDDQSTLRGHESFVYYVAFSPDGTMIASTGFSEPAIHVWDVASGAPAARLVADGDAATSAARLGPGPPVAFSSDSRRLVAMARGGVLQWDARTGEPLDVQSTGNADTAFRETLGEGSAILYPTSSVSPDGKRVACVQPLGWVGVYDADDCAVEAGRAATPLDGAVPIARLDAHVGKVYCVAFSPDGTRLATGGQDATARIWDAGTFEQLLVLEGHRDYVKHIAFSPDGSLLASASGDKTVRLWDTLPLHERRRGTRAPTEQGE